MRKQGLLVIIGIDTGARRLAICMLPEGSEMPWFYWTEVKQTTDDVELHELQAWLDNLHVYPADQVWLEKVVVPHGQARSLDAILRHAMTIGMVVATVGGVLIAPATWKAQILGYGHANKDDIREWVQWTSPKVAAAIEALTSRADRRADLYDAYCIALHGDLAWRRALGLDQAGGLPGSASHR